MGPLHQSEEEEPGWGSALSTLPAKHLLLLEPHGTTHATTQDLTALPGEWTWEAKKLLVLAHLRIFNTHFDTVLSHLQTHFSAFL